MHIKFLNRGTGSARTAKEYLLRKHDHKGELREEVQILRGNPEFVTQLADSLRFKHRYRSAVIAWHKDDQPTEDQIIEVLDEFERVSFAGLDPGQYAYYAVWHGEPNGGGHIHWVTARVELTSGKSLNIAPPGWQKTYDILRDKFNTKYQWARPEELCRRKLVNNKINIHGDMTHAKAKQEINKAVGMLINQGILTDAGKVEDYLNSLEGVTVKSRRGNKALSVIVDGIKKSIRLEGLAYGREFNAIEFVEELRAEQRARTTESDGDRKLEVIRINGELRKIIKSRAEYNQERYAESSRPDRQRDKRDTSQDFKTEQTATEEHGKENTGDYRKDRELGTDNKQEHDEALDSSNNRGLLDSNRAVSRELRPYELHNQPTPNTKRVGKRVSTAEEIGEQVHSEDLEQRHNCEREEEADNLPRRRWEMGSAIREKELNDTIRARIKADIEAATRAIQAGVEECYRELSEAYGKDQYCLQRYDRKATKYHREAERSLQQNINRTTEEHRATERNLQNRNAEILERTRSVNRECKQFIIQSRTRLQQFVDAIGRLTEKMSHSIKALKRIVTDVIKAKNTAYTYKQKRI